jgi:hypothetical protein
MGETEDKLSSVQLILQPTVIQSVRAHDQILIFLCLTITFFMQGALSDERTGPYFAVESLTG